MSCMRWIPTVVWMLGAIALAAEPPGRINYQGVLRDSAGEPLDGGVDMRLRLFNLAVAGSEILVDSHVAGGTGAVPVSGGLFNVTIGGGAVADGSGLGIYTALGPVFRDFAEVWLEVEVEGETLAPRVRFDSAAFALNADHLDGLDGPQLLRSDASDAFTGGALSIGVGSTLVVQGSIQLAGQLQVSVGPDADQFVYFFDAGSAVAESLSWSDAETRFELTDELALGGPIQTGSTVLAPVSFNRFGTATSLSGDLSGVQDVMISGDTEVASMLYVGQRVVVGDGSPTPNQGFSSFGEAAGKDAPEVASADDAFLAGDLEVDGALLAGGTIEVDNDGPDGQQSIYFYEAGSPTGESLRWEDSIDLFVASDGFLGEEIFSTFGFTLKPFGPDGDQNVSFFEDGVSLTERFGWDDSEDEFDLTDTLEVQGDLQVTGVKNFVQNDPTDPGSSVVFTALEGDEAATFTRGTARLHGGETRVALGPSFALVTNPEVGLTAHLTARGAAAELFVESLTPHELVVRSAPDAARDAAFDFIVLGLRIGYEDAPVIVPRGADAPVPAAGHWDRVHAARPDLRDRTALARHRRMADDAGYPRTAAPSAAELRRAIGEADPEASSPSPTSSTVPEAGATPRAESARPTESELVRSVERDDDLWFPVQPGVSAGDLLALDAVWPDTLRRADAPVDPGFVGVALGDAEERDGVLVARVRGAGLVEARVDAGFGAIAPGDLLTSSATPGHLMRSTGAAPGTIVGKALGALESGTGTIRVLVAPR
jgi:hypothetical protein